MTLGSKSDSSSNSLFDYLIFFINFWSRIILLRILEFCKKNALGENDILDLK